MSKPLNEYELKQLYRDDYIPMSIQDEMLLKSEEWEWKKRHLNSNYTMKLHKGTNVNSVKRAKDNYDE